MNRFLIATLAVTALALPAMAQENAFPQVTNDGAGNTSVQYSTGPRGNIVGGGAAIITGTEEGRPVIEYRGAVRAQAPSRPALAPAVPESQTQQG